MRRLGGAAFVTVALCAAVLAGACGKDPCKTVCSRAKECSLELAKGLGEAMGASKDDLAKSEKDMTAKAAEMEASCQKQCGGSEETKKLFSSCGSDCLAVMACVSDVPQNSMSCEDSCKKFESCGVEMGSKSIADVLDAAERPKAEGYNKDYYAAEAARCKTGCGNADMAAKLSKCSPTDCTLFAACAVGALPLHDGPSSCTNEKSATCTEYPAPKEALDDLGYSMCPMQASKASRTPCSKENLLGTCKEEKSTKYIYAQEGRTAENAKDQCFGGEYTPAAGTPTPPPEGSTASSAAPEPSASAPEP